MQSAVIEGRKDSIEPEVQKLVDRVNKRALDMFLRTDWTRRNKPPTLKFLQQQRTFHLFSTSFIKGKDRAWQRIRRTLTFTPEHMPDVSGPDAMAKHARGRLRLNGDAADRSLELDLLRVGRNVHSLRPETVRLRDGAPMDLTDDIIGFVFLDSVHMLIWIPPRIAYWFYDIDIATAALEQGIGDPESQLPDGLEILGNNSPSILFHGIERTQCPKSMRGIQPR